MTPAFLGSKISQPEASLKMEPKEVFRQIRKPVAEPTGRDSLENLNFQELGEAVRDYQQVVKGWGVVVGLVAGFMADRWTANPYLASLGFPLIVWGIAEVMEARSKILRFFQEARKQGLLVKGRTFLTSQIQTLNDFRHLGKAKPLNRNFIARHY